MIVQNSTGKKGMTFCYSISLSFNESTLELSWLPFNFYVPDGEDTDGNGDKYFQCPGGNILIERGEVNREYIAVVSRSLQNNMCVYQLPEGEVLPEINDDKKEFVFNVFVPTVGDISIVLREVKDE